MPKTKRWAVIDGAGSGWGRFGTRQEADDRKANLEQLRDSAQNPTDATSQFDVVKVSGS